MLFLKPLVKVPAFFVRRINFVLIPLALLFVIYSVRENFLTSTTRFDINHLAVDLKSIKERGDLHVTRKIIANRVQLVFENNMIVDRGSAAYVGMAFVGGIWGAELYKWRKEGRRGALDYIALCQVDARIPMARVQFEPDYFQGAIHVILPEVLIETGLTDMDQSFVWKETGNLPANAVQRAVYEAEIRAVELALERDICAEAYENAAVFFRSFFEALGFSKVRVTAPMDCRVDATGQSLSPVTNSILRLCRDWEKVFPQDQWHVDPHLPERKSRHARDNFENIDDTDYLLLLYDTDKNRTGASGLVLSGKGLHWQNRKRRSGCDTGKNFLAWKDFAKVSVILRDSRIVFGDSAAVFFDIQDQDNALKILRFFDELQDLTSTVQ